jgi:retinol dehydrogenase-12
MSLKQTFLEYFPPKPTFSEADLPDLAGKNYLITGGAAGIGKEVARILFSANANVYIAGRSLANIEAAKADIILKPSPGLKATSGQIIPVVLDLADLATIKPAVEGLVQNSTRFEVVFFNAGVMVPPTGSKTKDGYEMQWGTNVVGHFLLQRVLLPSLLSTAQQAPVRVIWTSSDAINNATGSSGIQFEDISGEKKKISAIGLYSQSKVGDVVLAVETAARYGDQNILSASLNPGHLTTDLLRHAPWLVATVMNATLLHEPRLGALTTLYAGFSDTLSKEANGAYFIPWGRPGKISKPVMNGLKNGSGKKLWDLLEKETAQFA